MMLIERHVSAYSGAIIRFNKLWETIYFMDFKLIDVEISSYIFLLSILRQYVEKKL